MTPLDRFLALPTSFNEGHKRGLTSVCSAHPLVIEAALLEASEAEETPCIEATCNQVNQDGGYTGMTPQDFRDLVFSIARKLEIDPDGILLGGDHLGPNPWRDLPAKEAMAKALTMTHAYAAAGFGKIHLDASMSCADDPTPLPAKTVAERAALLAQAAEEGAASAGHPLPGYIIGTEVPVPGGAAEALDHVVVSNPQDAEETISLHQESFKSNKLDAALDRVVALVVQPGVEFGQTDIHRYNRIEARDLIAWRNAAGKLVFEAHSTDYQTAQALTELVVDGFAILKVGPGLTFALREAYYALDQIAGDISAEYEAGTLAGVMEDVMQRNPQYWQPYVEGDADEQYRQRHEGLSDRIRYLWPDAAAVAAIDRLMMQFAGKTVSVEQLGKHYPDLKVTAPMTARDVIIEAVRQALSGYTSACKQG